MSISSNDDASNWKICQNRSFPDHLRKDIWRIYLKQNELSSISDIDFIDPSKISSELLNHSKKAAEKSIENARALQAKINSRNQDIFDKLSIDSNENLDPESSFSSKDENSETLGEKFAQIIEMYSSEYSIKFHPENGWLEIISVLYEVLECSRLSELYTYFLSIQHRFIANGFREDNRTCSVLRLLLQYHEPLVCSLLECNKLSFEAFSIEWFTTLFASSTQRSTAYALWDLYFLQSNPLLKIFIALVLLINAKPFLLYPDVEGDEISDDEELLMRNLEYRSRIELKIYEKDELLQKIKDLTKPMEVSDLQSLLDIALSYLNSTPISFRQQYLELLFCNVDISQSGNYFNSALCLHISPQELINWHKSAIKNYQKSSTDDLASNDDSIQDNTLEYLPIDLRTPEEYNAGHLKAAFFLDAKLKVEDSNLFKKRVQALFEMQKKRNNKIGHIVLMGSVWDGSFDEEKYSENVSSLNIVIAYFLRLQISNVSVLEGGYAALHEALGPFGIKEHLSTHVPDRCLVCKAEPKMTSTLVSTSKNVLPTALQNTAQKAVNMANESSGIFKKFSTLFTQQLETVQSVNKIYPSLTKTVKQQTHVNPTTTTECSPKSNAYRNTDSVFTIDDETSEEDEALGVLPAKSLQKPSHTSDSSTRLQQKDFDQLLLEDSLIENPKDLEDYPHRPEGLNSCQLGDRIVICNLESRQQLKGQFECHYVNNENKKCGIGHFLITDKFIIFLRDEKSLIGTQFIPLSGAISSVGKQFKSWISNKVSSQQKDEDYLSLENKSSQLKVERECVVNKVEIDEIIRINTNRKIPEIISFIYGKAELVSMGQQASRYRVYLPKAGEAVNMIKYLIYLNDTKETNINDSTGHSLPPTQTSQSIIG